MATSGDTLDELLEGLQEAVELGDGDHVPAEICPPGTMQIMAVAVTRQRRASRRPL